MAAKGIAECAIVLDRVAASGAAMNGSSALHLTMFGLNPVVKFGSERLNHAFLPRAATGELHVAFGVTEPDAGTDTSRISTLAIDDGAGGFVVRGRKIWTSKALESEVCLLLARTEDADPLDPRRRFDGLSLFVVDLDPAYCEIVPIRKLGRNAVASCEVAYDDLPVQGAQPSRQWSSTGGTSVTWTSGPSSAPTSSRRSPLQKVPGSYQFGGRPEPNRPMRS